VNALERDEDRDGTWRRACNDALGRDYPALWTRLSRPVFLRPPGFDVVPDWRWQQECALRAAAPGVAGMTRAQLERFVQHFERVSRHALATAPAFASRILRIDAARRVDPGDLDASMMQTGSAA
jgi:D-glycerate 3-kinase